MRHKRLRNNQDYLPQLGWLRPLGFALALALFCAGCGKRSPLIAPPDPAATVKSDKDTSANPLASKRKKDQGFTKPNQPFILDPIL